MRSRPFDESAARAAGTAASGCGGFAVPSTCSWAGVGLRRGRRDPETLRVGDALDFWRVEAFEPDRVLRLSAEMKLPGRAWLEFEIEPAGEGSVIRQTAVFDPIGLGGFAYWYGIYPLHSLVFRNMLAGLAKAAACEAARQSGDLATS